MTAILSSSTQLTRSLQAFSQHTFLMILIALGTKFEAVIENVCLFFTSRRGIRFLFLRFAEALRFSVFTTRRGVMVFCVFKYVSEQENWNS